MHTLRGSSWVPITYMEDPDGVPGSWFHPGPAPDVTGIWESEPVDDSFQSAFQIKLKVKTIFKKRVVGSQDGVSRGRSER